MAPPQVRHHERLQLQWWLWLLLLGVATILAAEIHMGAPGIRAWVPYAVLLPLAAWGLWWLGRIPVTVVGNEFRVDDARLPLRFVAEVTPLTAEQRRDVLGRDAQPLAFVIQRPWVAGAVKVTLADPDDPTPYWVISSHRPTALADAIMAARSHAEAGQAARPAPAH